MTRPSASKHTLNSFSTQVLACSIARRTTSAPAAASGITFGATDLNHSPISSLRASKMAAVMARVEPTVPFNARLNFFRVDFVATLLAAVGVRVTSSPPLIEEVHAMAKGFTVEYHRFLSKGNKAITQSASVTHPYKYYPMAICHKLFLGAGTKTTARSIQTMIAIQHF